MTTPPSPRGRTESGFSIIELTIIIMVTVSLIAVTVVGARSWKHGADRSKCILTIRNVQHAVRSYQNLYGYGPGSTPQMNGVINPVSRQLLEQGYLSESLYEQIHGSEECPGGGTYTVTDDSRFPLAGQLYMNCSLAEDRMHRPESAVDW